MKNIEELFVAVKEAEVNAHLWHLRTSSYAEHKALQELYEGLQDNLDSLIEQVQGKFGTKINPTGTIKILGSTDVRVYLIKLSESIEKFIENSLSDDKDLENTALLLLETINKVRYLLTLS